MQHITGIPRNQMSFSSFEDTISPDNPVRFIDAFVEALALGIQEKLRDIDGWLRNRLRYCIWSAAAEKKPERKRKILMRLGVDKDHDYAWSRTRKGGWRIGKSPILNTTITLLRLKKKGYQSMLAFTWSSTHHFANHRIRLGEVSYSLLFKSIIP